MMYFIGCMFFCFIVVATDRFDAEPEPVFPPERKRPRKVRPTKEVTNWRD